MARVKTQAAMFVRNWLKLLTKSILASILATRKILQVQSISEQRQSVSYAIPTGLMPESAL